MTHWNEIEKVFNEALLVETGARAVFLDGACAGDAALRAEVESLLASMNEAESFLEHPPVPEVTISDHGPRLSVGQPVSHYKIVSHIATGGMGEVYLAEDQKLRRKVALKVLNEQMLADGEQIRRFRREANAISALNHPNILTIFEFDAADDINFIASEYVEGETLRERLRRGPMPMREALDVSIQTLNALNTAHRASIVHRDIKPENIMIRDDGYVKVLDFGLAKRTQTPPLSADAETLLYVRSNPGVIVGTVKYMSPEQARGKVVDERSDIFSFGTVLYEMLAGKPPFTGETSADVMASILQSDAPSLVSIVPDTSVELDGVIGKALSKSPSDRYQSSSELLDELKAISKLLEADSSASFAGRSVLSARDGSRVKLDDRDALIGRDAEIDDVIGLLRRSDVRLVTLTGIGGTGKTRLSRAVAERLGGEFAGGSVFVELSCVRDPEMVGATIAQSLGVPEIGGDDVIETIRTALCERPTLLVLDNFEQVVAYSPRIADLIADIPGSKILATSRELLHLSAEVEYPVPPLAIPENDDSLTAAEARRFESVLLFERRAKRADPHFELTDENAVQVAEICSRLDGLPLAIELAAARAKVLSPVEILSKLDDRFSLLTGGAKDLPDRQRTIRGAIEWSYDLLSDDEKELFRRLSVFAGGFTHKTAEAVLLRTGFSSPAADGSAVRTSNSGSQSIGLLDLVTSLADKSLLVVKRGRSGERRFVMLDTVREYAAAAFSETEIANDMRLSHAEYFLELAETASPFLKGPDSREWLPRLEDEHDNIRGALKWAIESVPEIAARLAAAIRHLWTIHGHLHEGRRWSAEVLTREIDMPDTTRWEILTSTLR